VADINGQTEQIEDKHDAFVAFMGTPEGPGPLRTAEYDKMICNELLAAFSKRTTNSTMKQYEAVTIQVNGSESIFDDVITYVAAIATVSHDVGEIEAEAQDSAGDRCAERWTLEDRSSVGSRHAHWHRHEGQGLFSGPMV
jgi:hypothetical protein